MMDYYEKLMNFLNTRDDFCRSSGMRITAIREGYAEAVLDVEKRHFNGIGTVQGGALFTLADFACAAGINSFGKQASSLSASVSFLRPGIGLQRLTAKANLVRKGQRTVVFDVDVFAENGKMLLHSTMTGYISDRPMADAFEQ